MLQTARPLAFALVILAVPTLLLLSNVRVATTDAAAATDPSA
jgi:hypothetical protein